MKCDCTDCYNKPICKLCESKGSLQDKYPGVVILIEDCSYYRFGNATGFEFVKNNVKPNYKETLSSLGLGDEKEKEGASQTETLTPISEGKICDCCGRLLGLEKFQGDTCSKCGTTVCVDCAYVVDDKILCENCF